jgi:hypothetical protein
MIKRSTMGERTEVAKQAANEIETWLWKFKITMDVVNVENDKKYQGMDVDLLWKTTLGDKTIEIKGDTYHQTGNFFLETYSNKERNTPGCFMYTEAQLIYYYFVIIKKLYVLPMPKTRLWFLGHADEFSEKPTQTIVGNGVYYTTVGRLVPIKTLLQNVDGVKIFHL